LTHSDFLHGDNPESPIPLFAVFQSRN